MGGEGSFCPSTVRIIDAGYVGLAKIARRWCCAAERCDCPATILDQDLAAALPAQTIHPCRIDGLPIPIDTQAGFMAGIGAAIFNPQTGAGDRVQLGNVFQPGCIGLPSE